MITIDPVGAIMGMSLVIGIVSIIGYMVHRSEQQEKAKRAKKIILP